MSIRMMNTQQENVAALPGERLRTKQTLPLDPRLPGAGKALELISLLHTTLEMEEVLRLFSEEVGSVVPHDALHYCHPAHDIAVDLGKRGRNRFSYRLAMGGHDLGEISFTRRSRFAEEEVQALENLLCTLIFPLRNALLYRQALNSALRDPLTNLGNRSAMDSALQREVELARRHGTPLSLIVIDIDHFKAINDQYGHAVGDLALRTVARCAEGCIRSSDMLFRYGGEEFVILLANTSGHGAKRLAERVRQAIETMECVANQTRLSITASLGLATLGEGEDMDALFERADHALYRCKQGSRNCVCTA
jgi:diguanylate cyclase (GGDEF)-like protein